MSIFSEIKGSVTKDQLAAIAAALDDICPHCNEPRRYSNIAWSNFGQCWESYGANCGCGQIVWRSEID